MYKIAFHKFGTICLIGLSCSKALSADIWTFVFYSSNRLLYWICAGECDARFTEVNVSFKIFQVLSWRAKFYLVKYFTLLEALIMAFVTKGKDGT
jgi:hypothetical protein